MKTYSYVVHQKRQDSYPYTGELVAASRSEAYSAIVTKHDLYTSVVGNVYLVPCTDSRFLVDVLIKKAVSNQPVDNSQK